MGSFKLFIGLAKKGNQRLLIPLDTLLPGNILDDSGYS